MAAEQNLVLYQNDDSQVSLIIEANEDGLGANLADKRIELAVKTKSTVDNEIVRLSSVDGDDPARIIITDAAHGLAVADFTDLFPDDGKYWYHSWIADVSDPDVDRRTWVFGQLTVKAV